MRTTFLHIILLIGAAWLLSSCSANDPADGGLDARSEMAFAVSDLSRASVTTSDNFTASQFAIYGDMKSDNNVLTTIFNNVNVKYDKDKGLWVPVETQFWWPRYEYSFIALHPASAGISDAQYANSRLSFSYSLPDDYKAAKDLMVSTHRRKYENNTSSASTLVTLSFWHIMSRLNFEVKNDGAADKIKVTKVVLESINKTGAFTVTPASVSSDSKQTDDYTYSWTGFSNKGNLTADIDVDILENEASPLFPDGNALLVVPQPENYDVIMKITYTIYDEGADAEQVNLTAKVPIGGWEPGKVYTYSLSIEELSKEINLTVSVKPWQTPKGAGITVPES